VDTLPLRLALRLPDRLPGPVTCRTVLAAPLASDSVGEMWKSCVVAASATSNSRSASSVSAPNAPPRPPPIREDEIDGVDVLVGLDRRWRWGREGARGGVGARAS
jgi:hypothetical protein